MIITPIKTRIFLENENLEDFLFEYIPAVQENSIVVITSKIVALSEGRTNDDDSEEAKERLTKQESEWALQTKYVWLTLKDGMLVASAGIDRSNANGKLILLPMDSFQTAAHMRSLIQKKFNVKNVGVLITDSRLLPLRAGALAYAIGYAGFKGVRDNRGTPDIFGRELLYSQTDVADGLASAAVICMGEGAEQIPFCVITDPPVEWTAEPADPKELVIPPEEDVYRPFFENLPLEH
ncbi:MAG: coenzyme F420-0:L-glutamate ligase [Candidatus Uhrbacteria bacterium]|nr:coenzyme F420-0:L-glutamate ligase [Candidatus Uhrbacteria bacterium]